MLKYATRRHIQPKMSLQLDISKYLDQHIQVSMICRIKIISAIEIFLLRIYIASITSILLGYKNLNVHS